MHRQLCICGSKLKIFVDFVANSLFTFQFQIFVVERKTKGEIVTNKSPRAQE